MAAGHVLGQAQVTGHGHRNLQLSGGHHGVQHGCGTGHIALHGHHRSGGLQRVTAGVKGDTLTHQSHVSLRVLGDVLHHGKNRLAGRTLANAGNTAEALLDQAVVVEELNLNVCVILGQLSRKLTEGLGVQVRRGQVHQTACVFGGLTQDQGLHQCGLRLIGINRGNNQDGLNLFLNRILGLAAHTLLDEVTQHGAVRDGLNLIHGGQAEIEGNLLGGTGQLTACRTSGIAQGIQTLLTGSLIGTQTSQSHNAGTRILKTRQAQQLIGGARGTQRLQQLVDTLGGILRQRVRGQVRALGTLQNTQDQNVGLQCLKVGAVNRQGKRHRYSFAYVFLKPSHPKLANRAKRCP